MKKVLIAYFSAGGTVENMAGYIAEGVRFSGQEAVVINTEDIKTPAQISGYDGYIFGSPTYSLDVPGAMKKFLAMAQKADLVGKLGGAFGSYSHDVAYRHDNMAPAIILDSLQSSDKMDAFGLGSLILKDEMVGTGDGIKACQDYGRVFGDTLSGKA